MEKNNNIILPSLRISSSLNSELKETLKLLNANARGLSISISELRRMALSYFSEEILKNGLELKYSSNGKRKV